MKENNVEIEDKIKVQHTQFFLSELEFFQTFFRASSHSA